MVLFERSSHHVALTAAGRELLPLAEQALAAGHAFDERASAVAAGHRGVLRIATSDATANSLAMLARAFTDKHPGVGIELVAVDSAEKPSAVMAGKVDLAFARAPGHVPGVHLEALWTEPLVAVVPSSIVPDEPPHRADQAQLAALPLVIIDRVRNSAMHEQLLAECHRAGISPTLGPALAGFREGLAIIAAGVGWTMGPRSNAPRGIDGIAVCEFPEPGPSTTVWLMWRSSGASVHALAFAQVARAAARRGDLPA